MCCSNYLDHRQSDQMFLAEIAAIDKALFQTSWYQSIILRLPGNYRRLDNGDRVVKLATGETTQGELYCVIIA